MKLSRLQSFLLGALLLASAPLSAVMAMATKPTERPAPGLTHSYTWHDGAREHTVWLNPRLIAEFDGAGEAASAVRAARPAAQPVPRGRGATRIWRVDDSNADAALSAVRATRPDSKVSPVFHDGPNEGARLRALPGGVIVYLRPEWSASDIGQWATSRGLEIVRSLDIGPNVYLVKTAPGLAALELATSLRRSGEVVAAMPDWWIEATTR